MDFIGYIKSPHFFFWSLFFVGHYLLVFVKSLKPVRVWYHYILFEFPVLIIISESFSLYNKYYYG